ncbi:hypothetical protein B0J14DRAFT_665774 [Halenospora varia]|nr:hypothetical protein B0J14DRAFT_665774 [Halenospora varia]
MVLQSREFLNSDSCIITQLQRLTFHSDLVLSAMLGISALHLSALTPTDSILAYSSRHYLDHAVGKHQIALINVEEHNVESLLATVIPICDHTWLASHSTALNESYTLPLQTYHLARGVQVLFEQMCPTLQHLWYTKVERMPVPSKRGTRSRDLITIVRRPGRVMGYERSLRESRNVNIVNVHINKQLSTSTLDPEPTRYDANQASSSVPKTSETGRPKGFGTTGEKHCPAQGR